MTNQPNDTKNDPVEQPFESKPCEQASKPIPYSQWNPSVHAENQHESSNASKVSNDQPCEQVENANAVNSQEEIPRTNENNSEPAINQNNNNNAASTNIISNILEQERNAQQFNRGGRIELMLTEEQERDFKKARTFSSAAMICAVVSLFIGGMFLSAVGLGCAYASYRRVKKHLDANGNVGLFARAMKRTAVTSAMFCGFSFGLNAFAAWQMMPYLTDMINSGSITLPGSEATVPQNSTWG